MSYTRRDNANLYKVDSYVERYGRETALGTIVTTKTKFPFTLEECIIWMVDYDKNKHLSFLVILEDKKCLLRYAYSKAMTVHFFALDEDIFSVDDDKMMREDIYISFIKGDLIFEGMMEELVDRVTLKGGNIAVPFADLRNYFDPEAEPDESERAIQEADANMQVVLADLFPEFAITSKTGRLSDNAKTGDEFIFSFVLTDDRESWDDEGISKLFANNRKNKAELADRLEEELLLQDRELYQDSSRLTIKVTHKVQILVNIEYLQYIPE